MRRRLGRPIPTSILQPLPIYVVLIRSSETDRLSAVGPHTFDDPLIEGTEVTFNHEQWTVEEVEEDHAPPEATLVKRA